MLIIGLLVVYFSVLIGISWLTSRKADNASFFLGNKKSPWYIVAFGMIGVSLSGITFISIPGMVEGAQFSYLQVVMGYFFGYVVIAYVLMPIYYKLNVTSIYTYLDKRFGFWSYKTGAAYFLVSRIFGASIRLLLVANVLQFCLFEQWNVPFEVTVILSIALIWLYTFRGGIKTIIWTDALQTFFMLLSLGVTIWLINKNLGVQGGIIGVVADSNMSQVFFFDDIMAGDHFIKQFIGGMFIAIGMTGLDQDMMQKNLSCKNIKDAQKNMMSFAAVLMVVNVFFLVLGAMIYTYANAQGIEVPVVDGAARTDLLFPVVALEGGLGITVGVLFLLGLIAAAYSSADSALTSLTTSVSVDFLNIEKRAADQQERLRKRTHVVMSGVLFVVIMVLHYEANDNAITTLLSIATFTYGPLIGLFFFGILFKRQLRDRLVPVVCVVVPVIMAYLKYGDHGLFGNYQFGLELILIIALFTMKGLYAISYSSSSGLLENRGLGIKN